MTIRKRLIKAIGFGLFALFSFSSCGHSQARKEYEKVRTLSRGHELVICPIDNEAADFLKDVRESWKIMRKNAQTPFFRRF